MEKTRYIVSENRVIIILLILSAMFFGLLALLIVGSNFGRSEILVAISMVLVSIAVSLFMNYYFIDFNKKQDKPSQE